ncbi:hypothetical protein MOD68_19745, partial [Bacillus spizizenii]|nr:hypothetical protein [Bacillus spizizenii]
MKVKQLTSSCKSLYGNLGLTEMAAMNWHTISDNILKIQSLSGLSFTYKIGASWGLNQMTDTDGDGVTDLVFLAVDGGKQGASCIIKHIT